MGGRGAPQQRGFAAPTMTALTWEGPCSWTPVQQGRAGGLSCGKAPWGARTPELAGEDTRPPGADCGVPSGPRGPAAACLTLYSSPVMSMYRLMAEFWYTKQEPCFPHWSCQSRHALSITQPKAMGPGMPPVKRGPVSPGHAPGRQGRRAAPRSRLCGFSERGPRSSVISGVQGGLQSSLLGGPLMPFVLRRSHRPGKSMTMGPSSGLLGNGVLRSLGKGHLGCTPAR